MRQIKDGATKIAEAANQLARQAVTHFEETGEYDGVRLNALWQLAWALNGAFGSEDDGNFVGQMLPRRADNQLTGLAMTHGLSNCGWLANSAENFLTDYNARAKPPLHNPAEGIAAGANDTPKSNVDTPGHTPTSVDMAD